jgi:hypothetical protein
MVRRMPDEGAQPRSGDKRGQSGDEDAPEPQTGTPENVVAPKRPEPPSAGEDAGPSGR